MTATHKKIRWGNIFLIFYLIVFMELLLVSIHSGISWLKEKKEIEYQLEEIHDIVDIVEVDVTNYADNLIESKSQTESQIVQKDPYWEYMKMNLIDVNFNELKIKNSNTVGWIQVNGTNINYPFVQGEDNEFYLNHSFDKSYNSAGWVFLDYRNTLDSTNKNTIIYAHSRLDKTMFGSLKNILTDGWLDNTNNFVIKMSTEKENTLWQVFSVYHIPTTNDYIRVNFINDNDFLEFANMLKNRSAYNFNTDINSSNQILTLSTCYNKTDKLVLHAKLIKNEYK